MIFLSWGCNGYVCLLQATIFALLMELLHKRNGEESVHIEAITTRWYKNVFVPFGDGYKVVYIRLEKFEYLCRMIGMAPMGNGHGYL